MFDFLPTFNKKDQEKIYDIDAIAKLLKTTPEALRAFEKMYKKKVLDQPDPSGDIFHTNSREASRIDRGDVSGIGIDELVTRIVNELISETEVYSYKNKTEKRLKALPMPSEDMVKAEQVNTLPRALRPQLTGSAMASDMGESYMVVLGSYLESLNAKTAKEKELGYHIFRQGLDIMDLDPVLYEIIGMNKNSMGYWLPKLVNAVQDNDFFKIPDTTIIKVPLTLLQLTRLDYAALSPTTIRIVDEYCMKVFKLDVSKDYFIKTGTYSSKFDFRNAKVHGEKEVRELGEYLLYIHFQALQMASPLAHPCIYGVSTTNEWVVREFIEDKENNPTIYKGLPLHTEYRVFVDCDTDEIIGVNPYWDPEVMKNRFKEYEKTGDPHDLHDYTIYSMYESVLMDRYNKNVDIVKENIRKILPGIDLSGQWSIDIMQNGDDFYIIDMALAANSALRECVPKDKLKKIEENWIHMIPELKVKI